jgi:alpha-L-fucosidase
MTPAQSNELVDLVHTLQPQCLVSSRVGNKAGDYIDLGDGEMPTEIIEKPWEALFTHNDSWGYVWYDQNWKGPTELVRRLVTINAKGGNFLLNVGPQSDGALPEASVKVFRTVGQWIDKNAEAIYGTTHSPFPELTWGECTARPGKLYLHVFQWPKNGRLRVPGLHADVRKIVLLESGQRVKFTRDGDDLIVRLPEAMPDPMATVINLDYRGALSVDPGRTLMEGVVTTFESPQATLSGQASVKKHSWMEEFGDWKHAHVVEQWTASGDVVSWNFRAVAPGDYWIELTYSFPSGSGTREGVIVLNDEALHFQTQPTGDKVQHFFDHRIGLMKVKQPGPCKLSIHPVDDDADFVKLKSVRLVPFE